MKDGYLCIEVMRRGSQTFIQSVLQIYPYDMVFFHSLFYEIVLENGEQQV